ncbi:MAG: electron transfer flavoprotein-ubiquinone oxidoreductase [Kiritimatiellae bacterium]|nr:electron transfer flavoprotein-ubiquinone oxidoreductase [Kiritimatiellia bacterium]
MTDSAETRKSAAPERDIIEADVVCVGAGVACLSAVLRLLDRVKSEPQSARKAPSVLIFEKGREVGAHVLSGAVLDDKPFMDLLGPERLASMPVESRVVREKFYYLGSRRAFALPMTPPPMKAHGFPIASLAKVTRWLGELCEEAGAEIYTGLAAAELLEAEDGRVIGVRLGDKGVDKDGRRKPNFEPGPDVHARVVILGEGACGMLTEHLIERRGLAGSHHEQSYAVGIKELVRGPSRPERKGHIFHTFGYPLDHRTYGGGFVYCMNDTDVALGLVVALDYRYPNLSPHEMFRAFKAHPLVRSHLSGGRVIGYGAKVIPEGGWFAAPRLAADGALLVGDGAGLLDTVRLKGADIAVESGLAAGDTLFECWRADDWSAARLQGYPARFESSRGWRRIRRYRNVRACFQMGLLPGIVATGLSYLTGGLLPPGRVRMKPDHAMMQALSARAPAAPQRPANMEKELQFDILSDLYYSGTEHEENQPCHLVIKDRERCIRECLAVYGAPCTRFCPAQVYELTEEKDGIRIQAANCLHCGTCEIKDPLRNIEWKLPEGGGGPRYKEM